MYTCGFRDTTCLSCLNPNFPLGTQSPEVKQRTGVIINPQTSARLVNCRDFELKEETLCQ